MRFSAGVISGLLSVALLVTVAVAQPPFTGFANDDSGQPFPGFVNAQAFPDETGDVGLPVTFPPGRVSGWDFDILHMFYDPDVDTMYVGLSSNAPIIGDADGDGNPDAAGPELARLRGEDRPELGGAEAVVMVIKWPSDGARRTVIGVGASNDLSTIGVYAPISDVLADQAPPFSFNLNAPIAGPELNLFASPSALQPSLEFNITSFSSMPGFSYTPGDPFSFELFIVAGAAFQDLGIGEDRLPDDAGSFITFQWPLVGVGNIGDFAFHDKDADGCYEPEEGDEPLPGVQVDLFPFFDPVNPQDTQVTNGTGYYLFEDVLESPGYRVRFSPPEGSDFEPTTQACNSTADPVTGDVTDITVVRFQTFDSADAGFFVPASVGDRVWLDTNDNDVFDQGVDEVVEGALVELMDVDGTTVLSSNTTGADGEYLFSDLRPGDYRIRFSTITSPPSPPNEFVAAGAGTDDAVDSDADPITGLTAVFTLQSEDALRTVDAGLRLLPLGTKGNFVFHDRDNDGVYEPIDGDVPQDNVDVYLYADETDPSCDTFDGATFPSNPSKRQLAPPPGLREVAQTSTNAAGEYSFGNLVECDYYVRFDLPPPFVQFSPIPATPADNDNRADATGLIGPVTVGRGATVQSCDAGLVGTATIGDFVFEDTNGNGERDAGEPAVENVEVELLDSVNGDAVLGTEFTDVDGLYAFPDRLPGSYAVRFAIPVSPPSPPYDWTMQGADSVVDSQGRTPNFDLLSGIDNLDQDAGLVPVETSVGNFVFHDLNANGRFDVDEPAVPNVELALVSDASEGCRTLNNAPLGETGLNGDVLARTTTDANGNYLFNALVPCTYFVEVTLPSQFDRFSPRPSGPNDNDNRADPLGVIGPFVVLKGTEEMRADAGVFGLAAIGDEAWFDANEDGVRDAGEDAVADVTVRLLDSVGVEQAQATTDSTGNYLFTDLVPGTYSVAFGLPASPPNRLYDFTPVTDADSVADPATGLGAAIELRSNEDNLEQDVGLVLVPIVIGDFVFHDRNADGLFTAGTDEPLENVEVRLIGDGIGLGCRSFQGGTRRRSFDMLEEVDKAGMMRQHRRQISGEVLATQFTDSEGRYQFTDLTPCEYFVEVVRPAGFARFSPLVSGAGNDDNQASVDGVIGPFNMQGGDVVDTADAGIVGTADIGDFIFEDVNGNGLYEAGTDLPFGGVAVDLLNEDGVQVFTQTTDVDGSYLFEDNLPGVYSVRVYLPASPPSVPFQFVSISADSVVGPDGQGPQFELLSAEDNLDQDAGLVRVPLGSIGFFVWHDLNGDGIEDVGEPRVPDVAVLLDTGGCDVFGADGTSLLTDSNGEFIFDGLTECSTYRVCFQAPAEFTEFSPLGGDSVAQPTNGCSGLLTLSRGQDRRDVNAGIFGTATLGDFVWLDNNYDDMYDPSVDEVVRGASVQLIDAVSGQLEQSVFTDAGGNYLFTGLQPSSYLVVFSVPPNAPVPYEFVAVSSPDSVADPATGRSPVTRLQSLETNLDIDAGIFDASPPTCVGNCRRGWRPGCDFDTRSCVCMCDELCISLGDCCPDFCEACPRVDRVGCGTAVGDPHVHGFFGERFDLGGAVGDVMNLLSSETTLVNARLGQACRGKKTVFDAAGLRFKEHTVSFVAEARGGQPEVLLDGQPMGEQVVALEGDEHAPTVYVQRRFDADRRYGGHELRLVTPDATVVLVQRTHSHCGAARVDVSVQSSSIDVAMDGALGMTLEADDAELERDVDRHGELATKIMDQFRVRSGDVLDLPPQHLFREEEQ